MTILARTRPRASEGSEIEALMKEMWAFRAEDRPSPAQIAQRLSKVGKRRPGELIANGSSCRFTSVCRVRSFDCEIPELEICFRDTRASYLLGHYDARQGNQACIFVGCFLNRFE